MHCREMFVDFIEILLGKYLVNTGKWYCNDRFFEIIIRLVDGMFIDSLVSFRKYLIV